MIFAVCSEDTFQAKERVCAIEKELGNIRTRVIDCETESSEALSLEQQGSFLFGESKLLILKNPSQDQSWVEEILSFLKKEHKNINLLILEENVDPQLNALIEKKGKKINKNLVIASALLHDIERLKENHVEVGANLLKKLGFPEVSEVVKKHSLYTIGEENITPKTAEEKIVFYADKRVIGNKIVSMEERFKDLEKRYNVDLSKEFKFTKKIEKELLD